MYTCIIRQHCHTNYLIPIIQVNNWGAIFTPSISDLNSNRTCLYRLQSASTRSFGVLLCQWYLWTPAGPGHELKKIFYFSNMRQASNRIRLIQQCMHHFFQHRLYCSNQQKQSALAMQQYAGGRGRLVLCHLIWKCHILQFAPGIMCPWETTCLHPLLFFFLEQRVLSTVCAVIKDSQI